MKSIEEASRAVNGLDGKEVPHVSPRVSDHSGAPIPPLTAAIWREDLYQALMSRENMRIYADSMRRASTWYEKQTKSGASEMQAKLMPCRFYALGRGCIFGKNCGFSHDDHLGNPQSGAARPSFGGPPLPQPVAHPVLPSPAFDPGSDPRAGVAQLPYRQARVPVLAHDGQQSPTLPFVPRNEAHLNPGPGIQRVPETAYAGNGVGVATPWQPEHGSGASKASAAGRASPHLSTSNGRSVDHQQQPARGGGPSKAVESSETRRDVGSRVYSKGGDKTHRRGYPNGAHNRDVSADGRTDGRGGNRRDDSRDGNRRGRSAHGRQHWRSRSRGRGDNRSISRPGSSPRRNSGDFQRRGAGRMSSRDAGRERERRDSRSRRSKSRGSSADRSSRKHRRDGSVRQQRRDSRSNSPRRHQRDEVGAMNGRSASRRERSASRRHRATRNDRNRNRVSPAGQGRRRRDASYSPRARERRYESDGGDFDLDGRRRKKSRTERDDSRGRGIDHGRRDSDGDRGPFVGMAGGRHESDNVSHGHGWISSKNSGAFSRDGERRSFGVSPDGGLNAGNASHPNERYRVDDSRGQHGAAEWNDEDLWGQEFMQLEGPPAPDRTQFTVTDARRNLGTLVVPPPVAAPTESRGRKPEPKFSVTMDGTRRGGRTPRGRGRGRGRGGRSGNERGGRPPRGFQHDDEESSR